MSQTSNEQFITQLESILGAREKQYAREMVTKLGIENADDLSEVDDKLLKDDMGLKGIPRKRIMRCLEAYLTKKRPRDEQDSDQEEDSRPRKSNRASNVEESKVENDGSSRDALSDSQGDDDDGNVDDDDDDDDDDDEDATTEEEEAEDEEERVHVIDRLVKNQPLNQQHAAALPLIKYVISYRQRLFFQQYEFNVQINTGTSMVK